MYAKERLYLTADRKALVREGDKRAASLYAAVGHEIPDSAAALFGLVDGKLSAKGGSEDGYKDGGKGADKEKAPRPDKEKLPGEDKGAGTKGAADDLTLVKFIGTTSAKALSAAGITSYAQLAEIDPAHPPKIEGMGASANWAGIVASAIELYEAAVDTDAGARDEAAEGVGGADSGADQTEG